MGGRINLILAVVAVPACAERDASRRAHRQATITPTEVPESPSPEPLPTVSPIPDRIEPPELLANFPLGLGSTGSAVSMLQRALVRLTYDPGPIDGRYGTMTQQGVLAFEKVEGLNRDGLVDRRQMHKTLRAVPPAAPQRDVDDFIDIDVGRQVLLEVRDGRVIHTLPVSTGNGQYYYSTSGPATAYTPRGTFQIHSKVPGWKISYLGAMYYPSYFHNGYAIHGSTSVPPYPASHGCIRIPTHSAVGFFERTPVGTFAFVHD